MSRRPRCLLMVKEPRAGRVKTRLGSEIGMTAAAWWLRHRLAHLARALSDPRWDLILHVAPDVATASRLLPDLPRLPQGGGDLGDRMARGFRSLPPGPAVLVGADIPALGPAHVARAFAALGGHDAVFGPAADGGFWLVGFRRSRPLPPGLFAGVRWSTPHALADTLATLPDHGVALIDRLQDVDTAADLAAFPG